MPKNLLIVTGPQGSGNHLFSKIFSLHPAVFGWKDLVSSYWIPHEFEPFNHIWLSPEQWSTLDIAPYEHAMTSISTPFVKLGKMQIPQFDKFISNAKSAGWNVQLAIIGREKTIMKHQQTRLRGEHTYPVLESILPQLMKYDPIFLSHELLMLYKRSYIQSLCNLIQIPIDSGSIQIDEILKNDQNSKYINFLDEVEFDKTVLNMQAQTWKKGE